MPQRTKAFTAEDAEDVEETQNTGIFLANKFAPATTVQRHGNKRNLPSTAFARLIRV